MEKRKQQSIDSLFKRVESLVMIKKSRISHLKLLSLTLFQMLRALTLRISCSHFEPLHRLNPHSCKRQLAENSIQVRRGKKLGQGALLCTTGPIPRRIRHGVARKSPKELFQNGWLKNKQYLQKLLILISDTFSNADYKPPFCPAE